MKTLWIATAALVGLLALTAGRSCAQYPPAVRPPGVPAPVYSPYINLLRRGNPTYINYYGLVRPEVEFRNSIYGLQQGEATEATAISAVESGQLVTGHTTMFLNTSHFFLNRGGQGAPASAPTSGAPIRTTLPTAAAPHP